MAKWRQKEKNCLTNDVRSYRRKIRQYPQRVEPGKTERVYRRIAKFAENVHKNKKEFGQEKLKKVECR